MMPCYQWKLARLIDILRLYAAISRPYQGLAFTSPQRYIKYKDGFIEGFVQTPIVWFKHFIFRELVLFQSIYGSLELNIL